MGPDEWWNANTWFISKANDGLNRLYSEISKNNTKNNECLQAQI